MSNSFTRELCPLAFLPPQKGHGRRWRGTTALERGRTLLEDAPRADTTSDVNHIAEILSGIRHQEDRRKKAFFDFFR